MCLHSSGNRFRTVAELILPSPGMVPVVTVASCSLRHYVTLMYGSCCRVVTLGCPALWSRSESRVGQQVTAMQPQPDSLH